MISRYVSAVVIGVPVMGCTVMAVRRR